MGGLHVAWQTGPSPVVGLGPKLCAEEVVGQTGSDGIGVDGIEGHGTVCAVGLVEQAQPILMGQLCHVAIIVLRKQFNTRFCKVGFELFGTLLAFDGESCHDGKPFLQIVSAPTHELAGHLSCPRLPACLVAVNLYALKCIAVVGCE